MDDYLLPGPVRSSVDDRPDALKRLDEANDALTVLRDAFTGEEPLDNALQRLADTATRAIPDADAVSVSVVDSDRPRTAATTDPRVVDVDEKQYSAGRGPCFESARTLKPVRAVVGEHRDLWPEFDAAASEAGICAYLSVPVLLPASESAEARHVGTLNVYSRTASAFDPFDEGLMLLFTTAASATITSAQRWQRSREKVQHLERALESRAVIEQAKGVLMAVHSCDADEAFAKLVEESQHKNVKLRDVARALLESVQRS
ncbi:ANTAR domain-containing response regulator [Lentzea cavernae]|uniref:Transcriptional regulator n=1 Tax=Lentzea cavernae TaxID=2020703 RepID=A0ABQ3M5X5_9PSEU|nr:GAF and ANTAR domain-containing protein [Lentzea cavernae]GHH32395.1 transcriptional regulator [Lentzea cavernae]